ncbi:MAG: methyltransferase [Trichormus sp. ATA11-4-KO1]|jgi:trans-aconitate methyltransferase|nr:methyltransferase [Trichormus sp. ATA11-4-KO1]
MNNTLLFDKQQLELQNWTNDDWETPDNIAQAMAQLVLPSDEYILEPCAGTGQIAKNIPHSESFSILCLDINKSRVEKGRCNAPDCTWLTSDFLVDEVEPHTEFDLVITNPPFSKCMEFIERSLSLLNHNNKDARLLFLMPSDIFQAKSRARAFNQLNAHIHHVYPIVGRVNYLINGVPASQTYVEKGGKLVRRSGRQTCDAIWDIRPGKSGGCTTFIN